MGAKFTTLIALIALTIFDIPSFLLICLGLYNKKYSGDVTNIKDVDSLESNFFVDVEETLEKNLKYGAKITDKDGNKILDGLIQIAPECAYTKTTKSGFEQEKKINKGYRLTISRENSFKIQKSPGSKEIVDICKPATGSIVLIIIMITVSFAIYALSMVSCYMTCGTLCGCCARTNVPKAIVILCCVIAPILIINIILDIIREVTYYKSLGLEGDSAAEKYGFPKYKFDWFGLSGNIIKVIGHIVFTLLMVLASKQRSTEIASWR